MAIAGLLLFAATMYFPTVLQINLNEKIIQNNESSKILFADLRYTDSKLARLQSITTNAISEQEGITTRPTNKMVLVYTDSEVKQIVNEVEELNHQSNVNLAKYDANEARIKILNKYWWEVFILQIILIIASTKITVKGFTLWYYNIQQFIDKDIKRNHGHTESK